MNAGAGLKDTQPWRVLDYLAPGVTQERYGRSPAGTPTEQPLLLPPEPFHRLHRLLLVAGPAHAEEPELGADERAICARARRVAGRVPRPGARVPDLRFHEGPEGTGARGEREAAGEQHASVPEQCGLRDEARRREAARVGELVLAEVVALRGPAAIRLAADEEHVAAGQRDHRVVQPRVEHLRPLRPRIACGV